jgi:uncharacterized membrane protein YhaH (DUF805 family)
LSWYVEVLKRYAVFSGRARRKEYWTFAITSFFICAALNLIDYYLHLSKLTGMPFAGPLATVYCLIVLIPTIAVGVRRLHDTDRSGWWMLLFLVPLLGALILLVFFVQDSDAGDNDFGPCPKKWRY